MNCNGIDISIYQENIDWSSLDPKIKFCYIKASEGTTYQSPLLEQQYNNASKRLNVGFYHFLVGTSLPETQAENFYNQIKDKRNDLIPVLDVEKNFNGLMDYILRFIDKFKELSYMPIIIYTYTGFMDNLDSRLSKYPCWVANYNGGVKPPRSDIWGDNYIGHQYSGNGRIKGIDGDVDLNNFTDSILVGFRSMPLILPVVVDEQCSSEIKECKDFVGENCGKLQYMLNAVGYILVCDSDFGQFTYNAVTDYQTKKGLIVDGKAGTNTFNYLENDIKQVTCGINYVTPQATRLIQFLLGIKIDGIYGVQTESAVKNYQSQNSLLADGIVGKNTWGKMLLI